MVVMGQIGLHIDSVDTSYSNSSGYRVISLTLVDWYFLPPTETYRISRDGKMKISRARGVTEHAIDYGGDSIEIPYGKLFEIVGSLVRKLGLKKFPNISVLSKIFDYPTRGRSLSNEESQAVRELFGV